MINFALGKVVILALMLVFIVYVFTDVTPSIAGNPNDANAKSLKKEVTTNMWSIVPKK
ncbi:hypothetical protein [Brevibacillus reuszeri]|uniref:hypothetical protein n=1 Tax=Brevibacillus reuszeri TaxID=54915 RepID=UPI0013DEA6FC|nr:hypothetical protein [Brevibacillus reuszeri]